MGATFNSSLLHLLIGCHQFLNWKRRTIPPSSCVNEKWNNSIPHLHVDPNQWFFRGGSGRGFPARESWPPESESLENACWWEKHLVWDSNPGGEHRVQPGGFPKPRLRVLPSVSFLYQGTWYCKATSYMLPEKMN